MRVCVWCACGCRRLLVGNERRHNKWKMTKKHGQSAGRQQQHTETSRTVDSKEGKEGRTNRKTEERTLNSYNILASASTVALIITGVWPFNPAAYKTQQHNNRAELSW